MTNTLKWGVVFLTLALSGGGAGAPSEAIYDEHADAVEQIRAAVAEASKSRKNIILDFGGNWCFDCHVLDEQMHKPS